MKITTVFLVSSFNRLSLLKEACDNLLGFIQLHPDFGILLLDAGSTDGSKEYLIELKQKHPSVLAIMLEQDLPSFSEGVNRLFQQVLHSFPDATEAFLFETDNLIKNEAAVIGARALLRRQNNLGAVGFTVQNMAGQYLIPGSTFLKTSATILGLQVSGKLGLERMPLRQWQQADGIQWHYYDVLYTSPLLVKLEAWQKTGGMDAYHFPFAESDVHWAWKLKQAGFRQAIVQCTGIIHDNRAAVSAWSSKRVYEVHKRRLLYIRLVKGSFVAALITLPLALRHCIEGLYFLLSFRGATRIAERFKMAYLVFKSYP